MHLSLVLVYFVILSSYTYIWRPLSLSELTPYEIQSELTLLGSKASI